MPHEGLRLPQREAMQRHLVAALARYWAKEALVPERLPVPAAAPVAITGPLRLEAVRLPDWAAACGVDGVIMVPAEACTGDGGWQRVDWWLAAFLLLECWHERAWEEAHGPIHSYAFRLAGWDARVWEHAWVNRIALFLRTWAARSRGETPEQAFGPLPDARVLMTHDVDAVRKTLPIRLKQGAFNLFNAARHLAGGELRKAAGNLGAATRFLFGAADWWTFDALLAQERQAGIRARFHFCADPRRKTLKRWLLDPGYECRDRKLGRLMADIRGQRGTIGLHPTFDSSASSEVIRAQRQRLGEAAGADVATCRQHWLRFSWRDTWSAQAAAGIAEDTTLMFNDRPGFRAAAALNWRPWDQRDSRAHALAALPTVLMDSHFYDYRPMTPAERRADVSRWLDENRAVGGEIAVLWHPHTLSSDYGWNDGFRYLVALMATCAPTASAEGSASCVAA